MLKRPQVQTPTIKDSPTATNMDMYIQNLVGQLAHDFRKELELELLKPEINHIVLKKQEEGYPDTILNLFVRSDNKKKLFGIIYPRGMNPTLLI